MNKLARWVVVIVIMTVGCILGAALNLMPRTGLSGLLLYVLLYTGILMTLIYLVCRVVGVPIGAREQPPGDE